MVSGVFGSVSGVAWSSCFVNHPVAPGLGRWVRMSDWAHYVKAKQADFVAAAEFVLLNCLFQNTLWITVSLEFSAA